MLYETFSVSSSSKLLLIIFLKSENFQSSFLLFGKPAVLKNSKFLILKFFSSLVIFFILKSFLVITHYQRLLDYIKPDFVHILSDGKIIKTGCSELAEELEKTGYKNFN